MYQIILDAYNQKQPVTIGQLQWLCRDQGNLTQDQKDERWELAWNILKEKQCKCSIHKETGIDLLLCLREYITDGEPKMFAYHLLHNLVCYLERDLLAFMTEEEFNLQFLDISRLEDINVYLKLSIFEKILPRLTFKLYESSFEELYFILSRLYGTKGEIKIKEHAEPIEALVYSLISDAAKLGCKIPPYLVNYIINGLNHSNARISYHATICLDYKVREGELVTEGLITLKEHAELKLALCDSLMDPDENNGYLEQLIPSLEGLIETIELQMATNLSLSEPPKKYNPWQEALEKTPVRIKVFDSAIFENAKSSIEQELSNQADHPFKDAIVERLNQSTAPKPMTESEFNAQILIGAHRENEWLIPTLCYLSKFAEQSKYSLCETSYRALARILDRTFVDDTAVELRLSVYQLFSVSAKNGRRIPSYIHNHVLNALQDVDQRIAHLALQLYMEESNKYGCGKYPDYHNKAQSIMRELFPKSRKNVIIPQDTVVDPAPTPIQEPIEAPVQAPVQASAPVPIPLIDANGVKTLHGILQELRQSNISNTSAYPHHKAAELINILNLVNQYYQQDDDKCKGGKPIKEWTEDHIKRWAVTEQSSTERRVGIHGLAIKLAVLKRVNVLATTHEPRDVQLITVILLMDATHHGRLAQVGTGEGKSTIVSILASLKLLYGEPSVDVITSSDELAKRDAEEKQPFYDILGFTVSADKDCDSCGARKHFKPCYAAQVLYSSVNVLSWDLLQSEYYGDPTRGGRAFSCAIVDEVDSMLLDNGSSISRMGSTSPNFEFFNEILIAGWNQALRIHSGFRSVSNAFLWADNETGDSFKIFDRAEFVTKQLELFYSNLVSQRVLEIPAHMVDFAKSQTSIWAENAARALYSSMQGVDYFINQNEITIVDYANTGMVQDRSHWTGGLHQYLQLKHNIQMTPISLITVFISYCGFFKQYGKNIFGMTGTLGSRESRALLTQTYGVDHVTIPRFKQPRFTEQTGVVSQNTAQWAAAVKQAVTRECARGRAVLIINESMNDVDLFMSELRTLNAHLIRYDRQGQGNYLSTGKYDPRMVVVATNISGRGTDLKMSDEVERNGGLFVILTYLPTNLRVEEQAMWRTARCGNKGSAQIILNGDKIRPSYYGSFSASDLDLSSIDLPTLKRKRDNAEAYRIQNIQNTKLPHIMLGDELFKRFSEFKNAHFKSGEQDRIELRSIEEKWAILYNEIDGGLSKGSMTVDAARARFSSFINQLPSLLGPLQMNNPAYLTTIGNSKQTTSESFLYYDRAISVDPILGVHAYYNRARIRIVQRHPGYKEAALSDLIAAKQIIEQRIIPHFSTGKVLFGLTPRLEGTGREQSNLLGSVDLQYSHKLRTYQYYMERIDEVINVINNAKSDSEINVTNVDSFVQRVIDKGLCHENEAYQIHSEGLAYLFKVEEQKKKKKRNWFGALCCVVLGLIQIGLGALLTITGNVRAGYALVTEGVGDIVFAIRSAMGNGFSWSEYTVHKITSLSVTLVSMGIQSLRQTASVTASSQAAKNAAATAAAKQAAAQRAAAHAAACETAKQLNKEALKNLVKDQIVHAVVTAGVKEVINVGTDVLLKEAISRYKAEIREHIHARLMKLSNNPTFSERLNRMLMYDNYVNRPHFQTQINSVAFETISEKKSRTEAIASGIFKGVMSRQSKGFAAIVKLSELTEVIQRLTSLVDDFIKELEDLVITDDKVRLPETVPERCKDIEAARTKLFTGIENMLTHVICKDIKDGIGHPVMETAMSDITESLALKITSIGQTKKITEEEMGRLYQESSSEKPAVILKQKGKMPVPPQAKSVEKAKPIVIHEKGESSGSSTKPLPPPVQPKLYVATEAVTPIHEFLYRGDMRPPKGIFSEGFKARGTNTNILLHTAPAYGAYSFDSAYVSTSSSKRVAQAFALLYDDRVGFVYEVSKLNEGINVSKALKPYVKSGEMTMKDYNYYSLEREIAVPHKIEPQHIRGAWPVLETIGIDTESYQRNPHYKEPPEIPAARFARAAGKMMTGVGLVVDGINLYESYQKSHDVGSYDPLIHETARVAGGWSGAFATGSLAGLAGASACSSFGPQASLACGVVAGVYGSIEGYQAGSEAVTKVLLFDIRSLRKGTILEHITEDEENRYSPFNHY